MKSGTYTTRTKLRLRDWMVKIRFIFTDSKVVHIPPPQNKSRRMTAQKWFRGNHSLGSNSEHVVYVPPCLQMKEEPELKLLNIKVVHVPLQSQCSLKLNPNQPYCET